MVQALLVGRKAMTRRLAWRETTTKMINAGDLVHRAPSAWQKLCVSERIWVKETWGCREADPPGVRGGRAPQRGDNILYEADLASAAQWAKGNPSLGGFCWRTSRFMPRWASRITLTVTSVRLERLQAITTADIRAEGLVPATRLKEGAGADEDLHSQWHELWDTLHGPGAWAANPDVVVIGFDAAERNIDA